jgi:hypothetical protein
LGFFEGEAGFYAGTGVAGVGEPGGGEVGLATLVETDEVGWELGEGIVEEGFVDGSRYDAVALGSGVDAVFREGAGRLLGDGGVDVDDVSDLGFEGEDVFGVAGDDVAVVVLVDGAP